MVYTMEIFAHGGYRWNRTPSAIGAAAAVLTYRSGEVASWVRTLPSLPTPTSQRAELSAIILALETALGKYASLRNSPYLYLTIYCDSHYAIQCMTQWINRWTQNGWIASSGQQVANQDLLIEASYLHDQLSGIGVVRYGWVSREINWEADSLCIENLNEQESEA